MLLVSMLLSNAEEEVGSMACLRSVSALAVGMDMLGFKSASCPFCCCLSCCCLLADEDDGGVGRDSNQSGLPSFSKSSKSMSVFVEAVPSQLMPETCPELTFTACGADVGENGASSSFAMSSSLSFALRPSSSDIMARQDARRLFAFGLLLLYA